MVKLKYIAESGIEVINQILTQNFYQYSNKLFLKHLSKSGAVVAVIEW